MKKLLLLLLVLLPVFAWSTSRASSGDPDYHLDVKFDTNGNALKGPFSWRKGDVMVVTTLKNDKASSPEAVIKSVHYYINGEFVGSVSKPFKFVYELDDIAVGHHKLLTKVYWNANGYEFYSDFNWDLYIDPSIASGNVINQNIRNGYATYEWPSGYRFEGHWKNNKIDGTGIIYWSKDHYYVGHWINGKRWGYGIEVFPNTSYRLLYYENDKIATRTIHDSKTFNTGVGIYIGEMSDGRACGNGTFCWNNGGCFEGTWTADGKSRYGVLYWDDSQKPRHVGEWTDEKLNGYGCMISESGQLTVGFWENGTYLYKSKF